MVEKEQNRTIKRTNSVQKIKLIQIDRIKN